MATENRSPLTQDEIDYVLCHLPRGNRKMIIEFFGIQSDKQRRVCFLKDLLGNGGGNVHIPGIMWAWTDGWRSKGFIIDFCRSESLKKETVRLTWNRVATRIAQLIEEGSFYSD